MPTVQKPLNPSTFVVLGDGLAAGAGDFGLSEDLQPHSLPAQAAQQIIKGWAAGDFEIHFPKRFTLWLKAMQHLTDGLYFAAIRRSTGL